ncbi:MAG: diguanylate cyclase [Nitrospirae bacterium]|nr:diguanylate cyclase [Nitrospirota bacterium]
MEKILINIIKLCMSIDQRAAGIYSRLSSDSKAAELKAFWMEMSEDEKEHVEFWEKLLPIAENRLLPQIFDHPERIKIELDEISGKVDGMLTQYDSSQNAAASFLLASKMESYMLHPAFESLFYFMNRLSGKKDAGDRYQLHIDKFVTIFSRYEGSTPELELIGKTLRRLWRRNRQLVSQPSVDGLTGILNRQGFFNVIKPLLYLAQRNKYNVGFLVIDIDNLRKISEDHGKEKADETLKKVAHILRANIRISDVAGRYGYEDFIIFLPDVLRDSIKTVAENLRAITGMETIDNIPVTISIGASCGALGRKSEEDAMMLIKRATACLYTSKQTGKNKVTINSTH